jgi:hypothetical protein
VPAAAKTIATTSTIANGAATPSLTITGVDFKEDILDSDLTVVVGTTGLTLGAVTFVDATSITVAFTGTAAAGSVTIQAKTSAFTVAPGAASNTLTVTVPAAAATSYTLTGPTTGTTGVETTDFTLTPNGAFTGTITITFGGAGKGGLTTQTVVFAGEASKTFTFTPDATGAITLTASDDAALTDPAAITYTTTAAAPPAPPAPASITPSTPQTALVLTTSTATVSWGSQVKLTLTGGSGTGAVTYSSTGATFCAVDRDGNLTPISVGTCTVTANKAADGIYGSAQSNSITITATESASPSTTTGSTSNSGVAMVVGKPVKGVATVKFNVADTYAGDRVSVILATKSRTGNTLYKTLGTATVGSTGAVSFKTKVKLPVGAVLQLKSAGTVILSKSIK